VAITRRGTVALFLVTGILNAPRSQGQSPAGRPEFEVASVKRNLSGVRGQRGPFTSSPGTFTLQNAPLRGLILNAYSVTAQHLVGGPDWVASDAYDINAKARVDAVEGTKIEPRQALAEAWVMLQSLLEDRFRLKVHWETRELPVYVLTMAKGGLKMEKATCMPRDENNRPAPGQEVSTGFRGVQQNGLNRTMNATGVIMGNWIPPLEKMLRGDVIDKTELTGRFNIHLAWTVDASFASAPSGTARPDEPTRPTSSIDPGGPSLFTAFRISLG